RRAPSSATRRSSPGWPTPPPRRPRNDRHETAPPRGMAPRGGRWWSRKTQTAQALHWRPVMKIYPPAAPRQGHARPAGRREDLADVAADGLREVAAQFRRFLEANPGLPRPVLDPASGRVLV